MALNIVEEGSSIQEVINNSKPGDTILVESGIYNEALFIDKNVDDEKLNNLHIIANGKDVIITGECIGDIVNGCYFYNVSGCEIKGFNIKCFSENGIKIENDLENIGYNRVLECCIYCCDKNGIEIKDSKGNLLDNNEISKCKNDGIRINENSIANRCTCNVIYCIKKLGIKCSGDDNVIIASQICNLEHNSGNVGICNEGENCLFYDNTVFNCCGDCIESCNSNNIFICNDCRESQKRGIDIHCGINNCLLKNAVCNCCGTGIKTDSDYDIIDCNGVSKCCDNGLELADEVTGCIVINNNLYNNCEFDIKAPEDEEPMIENVIIKNNCRTSSPPYICAKCRCCPCRRCGYCVNNKQMSF